MVNHIDLCILFTLNKPAINFSTIENVKNQDVKQPTYTYPILIQPLMPCHGRIYYENFAALKYCSDRRARFPSLWNEWVRLTGDALSQARSVSEEFE